MMYAFGQDRRPDALDFAARDLGCCGGFDLRLAGLPIPWQQFIDPLCRIVREFG